jgi:hypothetical protein
MPPKRNRTSMWADPKEEVMRVQEIWLREPEATTVEVENGKVALSVTADSRFDAELVGTFAAKVPGVVEVDSSLRWPDENGPRS